MPTDTAAVPASAPIAPSPRPSFARRVWRLLVAIKDGLVLLFMLLFFSVLYAALTGRPSAGPVRDGALLLKLDGAVVEEPAAVDPLAVLVGGASPTHQFRTRDLVRALDAAASDSRIKAVVLDLSRFTGGGLVTMQEVGAAMDRVRAAKKPVLTYAVGYADDGVMLAAHSSEAWLNPMGGAFVLGPGGHTLYYAKLFEKLKLNYHIYRVGTYKDYVEPYIRSDQSPASKEAASALLAAVFKEWQADVTRARPKAQIARITADPTGWIKAAGGDAAKAALAAGLVDKLGDKAAFGARVAELAGTDPLDEAPGAYAHTSLKAFLAAHPESSEGKGVAVVTVAGEIVDGKAGPGIAGGDRVAKLIDTANADDMPALVLRVDSPGGSVLASEQIRGALERFRAKGRPVAISMANYAASGGYWVSTPGQRIFARPGTITGSIGIFAAIPSFEKSLASVGINGDGVRTTPLSGQPDPFTGFTPEVETLIQSSIESGYARFLGLVAKARGKTPAEIDPIAQGRVWDGGAAKANGLVDDFGGLDEAVAWAAGQAKLGNSWHAEFYGSKPSPYAELLDQLSQDQAGSDDSDEPEGATDLVGLASLRQQALLDRAAADLTRLLGSHGAQAYCLECPVEPGAVQPQTRVQPGLLARIAARLGFLAQ